MANTSTKSDLDLSSMCDQSILDLLDKPFHENVNLSKLRSDHKYKGFDSSMGTSWIYPTNYPIREYQFNISHGCLFRNTLVVLPTGLGKTFIASVVMYNIFRWYPNSKIVFMAPTRPLVAQQIEACYQVMGFPRDETIELTGKQSKKIRASAWQSKRVFYVTPQVVWSDLNDPEINFPINDIKLIVVDEAHKAKGKYAYTEVIQSISARNKLFRVLALSATPGRVIKDVVEVVKNLLITKIEVRSEHSIDVAKYVFKKHIKTIVVPLGEYLSKIRNQLHQLIDPYVRNLAQCKVIGGNMGNLTKAWLLYDRSKFLQEPNRHPEHSNIMSDFSVCISMYHALELLERHGVRVFLNYFDESSTSSKAEEKFFVMRDANIQQFLNEVRAESGVVPFPDHDMSFYGANVSDVDTENTDFGHPKFKILQEKLLEHFEQNPESKAIIFCEYRESVFLINRLLLSNRPLIKPKVFVGQGSAHARTITQKEQIAIMNDFRSGKCNTLIATCVAEEGIDVGEVDFILCFDVNNKNPIRFIQRIGRTGRKRQGKVTMLVAEGKEHQILKEILATKDGINQKIAKSNEVNNALYMESPRLVPPEFNPQCIETFIQIKKAEPAIVESPSRVEKPVRANRKKPTKKAKSKSDMRNFFKPIESDNEINEVFKLSNTAYNDADAKENVIADDPSRVVSFEQEQWDKVHQNQSNASYIPLGTKLQRIYERYREIKRPVLGSIVQNQKQLGKSTANRNTIPAVLKRMYLKNELDDNIDYWSNLSSHNQTQVFQLMSFIGSQEDSHKKSNCAGVGSTSHSPTNEKNRLVNLSQGNCYIDPDLSLPVFFANESKYASQRCTQKYDKTPAIPEILSSTPNKSKIFGNQMRLLIDSPIKVIETACNKTEQNSTTSKYKNYLLYLGLRTIDDLFSDVESENEIIEPTQRDTACNRDQSCLSENMNAGKHANDSTSLFASDTQYTVSRVLQICDEAEQTKIREQGSASVETPRKPKRLNVGSISNLFCDEDDDDYKIIMERKCDEKINSKSGSDCTIDYDLNDVRLSDVDFDIAHDSKLQLAPKATSDSEEFFSTCKEAIQRKNVEIDIVCSQWSTKEDEIIGAMKSIDFDVASPKANACDKSPSILNRSSTVLSRLNGKITTRKLLANKREMSSQLIDKNGLKNGLISRELISSPLIPNEEVDLPHSGSPFITCRVLNSTERNQSNSAAYFKNTTPEQISVRDDLFECKTYKPIATRKRRAPRRKKTCAFIDDEAGVSGNDSSDEEYDNSILTADITANIDEGDPSVDMRAKYLQSIRDRDVQRRFRIPPVGYRNPVATQNIFSQIDPPEDESTFLEDSFVVNSDEDFQNESSEELSELELAELILKSKHKFKRKLTESKDNVALVKKRRRIVHMSSDSD